MIRINYAYSKASIICCLEISYCILKFLDAIYKLKRDKYEKEKFYFPKYQCRRLQTLVAQTSMSDNKISIRF